MAVLLSAVAVRAVPRRRCPRSPPLSHLAFDIMSALELVATVHARPRSLAALSSSSFTPTVRPSPQSRRQGPHWLRLSCALTMRTLRIHFFLSFLMIALSQIRRDVGDNTRFYSSTICAVCTPAAPRCSLLTQPRSGLDGAVLRDRARTVVLAWLGLQRLIIYPFTRRSLLTWPRAGRRP